MAFSGFSKEDFDVFMIAGLSERMEAIRGRIQPKFRAISADMLDEVAIMAEDEMYFHYAKHLRRVVNPPKDTWMAFCHNKRGYKKHPHFQIGLFDDRLFIWLAFIYEMPSKKEVASAFIDNIEQIESVIPSGYVLSFDHMKKDAKRFEDFEEGELEAQLIRFRDVAKAELLIGQQIMVGEEILSNPEQLLSTVKEIYATLMPIYKMSRRSTSAANVAVTTSRVVG